MKELLLMSSSNQIAISVEDISKKYSKAHIGSQDTSLREQFTTIISKPWKLFQGSKRHGKNPDIVALNPISFNLKKGECLGILGRNGSGKSTLLKILARITLPTTGTAKINGTVASILEVGTGFHPELTGAENIYLNGAILGLKKSFIRDRYNAIVAFSELADFMDVPVKRYSSGMYVRLAFSVAAHLESDILLIDEILAVGDAAFRDKCLDRMKKDIDNGRTIIFVSHIMEHVQELCTSAIHIHRGKMDYCGDVDVAIDRYNKICSN